MQITPDKRGRRWAIGPVVVVSLALGGTICFVGLYFEPIFAFWGLVPIVLSVLFVAAGFVGYCRRAQTHHAHHSSAQIIPGSFVTALDGLTEGVVVLDYEGRFVYSNPSFLQQIGSTRDQLLGMRARDLAWRWQDLEPEHAQSDRAESSAIQEPSSLKATSPGTNSVHWLEAVKAGHRRQGQLTGLGEEKARVVIMNSVPIVEAGQAPRGALISFADVTKLNSMQSELVNLMGTVRESSRQLRQHRAELEELILRDPLTGCYHRHAGMEMLERYWNDSQHRHDDLGCLIVDIDYFRLINERHGHVVADQLLQEVADCLRKNVRECDLVCRFDGEKFLILLPQSNPEDVVFCAEGLRRKLSRLPGQDNRLTVSIGVACRSEVPDSPSRLLEQAEDCLIRAKKKGRNQVCRFDSEIAVSSAPLSVSEISPEISKIIPYPAVTALLSALAFRDHATATHTRRVADLCVAMGQRLMSMSNCYVLEISALLHDIGKIGVPDALLHKSEPLTEEEWKIMHAHDKIGVEIVRTAFANPELTGIVENYTRPYSESTAEQQALPLGARILAIADAYDSMTTDQIYRSAISSSAALTELRRCAGTQFDPEIVSHFEEVLLQRRQETTLQMAVDVEAALEIGLELEGLAEAVDQQDIEMLKILAGHLCHAAGRAGAHEITAKAIELEQAAIAESDHVGILQCANELLQYCRATQSAYTATRSPPTVFPAAAGENAITQLVLHPR